MNKYIKRAEAYKEKAKQAAIDGLEKMKAEYDEAKEFYNDTGYNRYFNKMQKLETEIEETEEYLRDTPTVKDMSTDQYKDYLRIKQLCKSISSNIDFVLPSLPDCAEKVRFLDCKREIKELLGE